MKIFLTGATGFVGSHLAQHLSESHEVIKFNRWQKILDRLHIAQPNVIINCAAEIYEPELMYRANVDLLQNILQYCRAFPRTRVIHFGSSSEYGECAFATREDTPLQPSGVYAATKAAASLIAQNWARAFDLDVIVARIYSPYGPGDRPRRLWPTMWRSFFQDEAMTLSQGVHDWLYISDLVRAVDCLLEHEQPGGRIVNVASGYQTSNQAILEAWRDVTGRQGNVTLLDHVSTPPVWCADISRMRQLYDWQPNVDIRTGIEKFVQVMSSATVVE